MAEDDTDPLDGLPDDPHSGLAKMLKEANEDVYKALEAKRQAYVRFYAGKPIGDDIQIVTNDQRQFCRGDQSAFDADQRIHALLTGRQEVWLRIKDFSTLSADEIREKYTQQYEAKTK